MTLGQKLEEFGKGKFGTITAFAEALDMSMGSLYSYLNNRSLPGTPILRKLKGMGCDLNWLLEEEEGKVKEPGNTYNANREVQLLREEIKGLKKIIASVERAIAQTKK